MTVPKHLLDFAGSFGRPQRQSDRADLLAGYLCDEEFWSESEYRANFADSKDFWWLGRLYNVLTRRRP